jgi:hypothetical protein
MLFSDACTKVRSATLHDDDTQFNDAQLLSVLAGECRRLSKWTCSFLPALREAVVSGIAVTSTGVILKSALVDFERLLRVERLANGGVNYFPVDIAPGIESDYPYRVSVREQPSQLLISPASLAAGTYQVVYLKGGPLAPALGDTVDLIDELYDVMVEQGCMWARQRHNEHDRISYHEKRSAELMESAYGLRNRYGNHGTPGLKRERRWW